VTVTDQPSTFVHPGIAAGAPAPTSLLPEEAAVTLPADRTIKAELLADFGRAIKPRTITLLVPDRPGYSVDFDVRLNADLITAWTKEATGTDAKGEPQMDYFTLELLTIAGQCRGIRRDGELVRIDGEILTFTSPFMTETFGSVMATETVRLFYGDDNAVAAVFARIQTEAAAGSLDPTAESSS
jgi:hypothetical protein